MSPEIIIAGIGIAAAFASSLAAIGIAAWKISGQINGLAARMDGIDRHLNARMDGFSARLDGIDKHLNARMDGMQQQINNLATEVRGINEFLRREKV